MENAIYCYCLPNHNTTIIGSSFARKNTEWFFLLLETVIATNSLLLHNTKEKEKTETIDVIYAKKGNNVYK